MLKAEHCSVTPDRDPIRIVVADDHPIFREGLVVILSHQPDMLVVGEYDNGLEAVEAILNVAPDVAVIDLKMPGMSGVAAAAAIVHKHPECRILMLSSYSGGDEIQRAMRAGVRGYLLKESRKDEVLFAIRELASGRFYLAQSVAASLAHSASLPELTAREREILVLIAEGKTNKEIGSALGITEGTVKGHVNAIMHKMKVGSRTEAAFLALRIGILRD